MYLSDAEVEKLALNMLTWLSEDGVVFFRESCFRQSGDKSRSNNPTHYRNPRQYFDIFDKTKIERDDGGHDYFELIVCKSIDTYAKVKQNQNQVCWKWRKTSTSSASGKVCIRTRRDGSGRGGATGPTPLPHEPTSSPCLRTYSHVSTLRHTSQSRRRFRVRTTSGTSSTGSTRSRAFQSTS